MAHIECMRSTKIHLAHRNPAPKRRESFGEAARVAPCPLVPAGRQANSDDAEPRFSATPLSDPGKILQRMPAQAVSPVLLELLDLITSPIILCQHSPTGELREMAPGRPALAVAA